MDVFALFAAFFVGSDYRQLAQLANAPQQIWVWLSYGIPSHFLGYLSASIVLLYWFWERGHYARRLPFWDGQRQTLNLVLSAAMLEAAFLILLSEAPLERWAFIATWGLALAILVVGRVAVKVFMMWLGLWVRPTIIIGIGANAMRAFDALAQERLMGYPVVGFATMQVEVLPQSSAMDTPRGAYPVFSLGSDPVQALNKLGRPNVVVALDSLADLERIVHALSSRFGNITIIPPLGGLPLYGMEISHFFSHDLLLMRVRNNLKRGGMQLLKRTFDLVCSTLFIVLFWWLFIYFIVCIRKTGGPAIFGHSRVGRHGRIFICYKFRTMIPNAEAVLKDILSRDSEAAAEWARDFKLKNDPRITPIGRFLRLTSLDELPQIWNVLKGEMSFVGPRPVVQPELERYGEYVDYYLETKPGITGLWQVSGRNDTSYAHRVALDVWYARNWSLWYDLIILLKTGGAVIRKKGAY